MIPTASLSLFSVIASTVLAVAGWGSPLAVAHLAFAVGVVPLIFAAMMHFVPVLTRTGDIDSRLMRLPNAAQAFGVIAVLAMQGVLPYALVHVAALGDLLAAAILLNWIVVRVRATLGSPHPGWRWYGAALGCLLLALCAVLLIPVLPRYWPALRLFHLHLNTTGLIGLAALGTLPVLLPTALGKPDPEAAGWLRRRLWLSASGTVVLATGAAIAWPFAAPGALLILVAAMSLAGQWVRRFGLATVLRDGVAASLFVSLLGLVVALMAGLLHGAGLLPTRPSLFAWAAGFLLPLVTGALSQLLPVWRWPGPVIPARGIMRQKLAARGTVRAGLFLAAALAMMGNWPAIGGVLTLLGLAFFVVDLVQAVRVQRASR